MILDTKQTTVAYRCPCCGMGVVSVVGIFTLNADMVKLKCECGGSEMTVVRSNDGKVRLTVPCIICPKPHNFTLNSSLFFGRELFVLPCPYTDVNICFVGDGDQVSQELERTQMELLDMLGEDALSKLDEANHGDLFTDPQILNIVMFVVNDLNEENKIICRCPLGEGDYTVAVEDGGVRVSCKNCGASQFVPTDSLLGAHAFLNCESLHLE